MSESSQQALLVRPEFADDLVAELAATGLPARLACPGLVVARGRLPSSPFVFERQRLPEAAWLEEAALKPVGDETLAVLTAKLRAGGARWSEHVMATDTELSERAAGFARTVIRLIEKQYPDVAARHVMRPREPGILMLQLCRAPDGLWHSTAPFSSLSCPWPGGIARIKDDPRAPSRSYLKLEEAFERMGESPVAGQTAVDLGAAPGGWSLALVKRGCHVTAVDNGPLRLPPPEPGWGRLSVLRANGITFEPRAPVDWLVADMLVAPGVALGLLRRWMGRRLMRRFVVNVKLPQQQAFAALQPVLAFLRGVAKTHATEVRQLFHDRREVTVMGRLRDATNVILRSA